MGGRLLYVEDPSFIHIKVPGGYAKPRSLSDISYIRNQTVFALRSCGLASIVVIPAFGAYLLIKGMRISTLVSGIAQGIVMVFPR